MLDVYMYGSGECDQFAVPDDRGESKVPVKIEFNTTPSNKVYKVCCGGMHTLVLTTIGRVYSWGCNDNGVLGREGVDNTPGLIEAIPFPMTNITAGDSHSIAYNPELNLIYRWGFYRDNSGQLGDPITVPEKMDTLKYFKNTRLTKVVSGANHTLVLAGQSVYAWGNAESGQTGINPNSVDKLQFLYPKKFATKNVVDIFSGINHSFLVAKKGKGKVVKGWGFNKYGQLGIGNKENQWIPQEVEFFTENNINILNVTGGDYHSIFLTDTKEVYVSGKNDEGQCGVPLKEIPREAKEEQRQGMVQEKSEVETNQIELPKDSNPLPTEQADASNNQKEEVDNDILTTPVKLEFFKIPDQEIVNVFSSMNFSYAQDQSHNQIYSWGMGDSYVLGNKKEANEKTPYAIKKEFFYNLTVDQISLGCQHVAVALYDPNVLTAKPELEYNYAEAKELLLQQFPKKTKPGKRKVELTEEEKKENEEVAKESIARNREKRKPVEKQEKAVEAPKRGKTKEKAKSKKEKTVSENKKTEKTKKTKEPKEKKTEKKPKKTDEEPKKTSRSKSTDEKKTKTSKSKSKPKNK